MLANARWSLVKGRYTSSAWQSSEIARGSLLWRTRWKMLQIRVPSEILSENGGKEHRHSFSSNQMFVGGQRTAVDRVMKDAGTQKHWDGIKSGNESVYAVWENRFLFLMRRPRPKKHHQKADEWVWHIQSALIFSLQTLLKRSGRSNDSRNGTLNHRGHRWWCADTVPKKRH